MLSVSQAKTVIYLCYMTYLINSKRHRTLASGPSTQTLFTFTLSFLVPLGPSEAWGWLRLLLTLGWPLRLTGRSRPARLPRHDRQTSVPRPSLYMHHMWIPKHWYPWTTSLPAPFKMHMPKLYICHVTPILDLGGWNPQNCGLEWWTLTSFLSGMCVHHSRLWDPS